MTVCVPATTSNLGPGFDCFGIALRIYNYVTVARAKRPATDPMIAKAAARFFMLTGAPPFNFNVRIRGDVPRSRGLGSSVTVRLGVLMGLNAMTGNGLTRQELFELCAQLEGHGDNAAPACFGGFTLATPQGCLRFPVSSKLSVILLIPDFEVSTPAARKLLPRTIAFADAVANSRNAAVIAASIASSSYHEMRGAFVDYLHQPYREKLVPFLSEVTKAAEQSGAIGAFLSGSGSTIAALTAGDVEAVAAAMKRAAGNVTVKVVVTKADNRGARIVR